MKRLILVASVFAALAFSGNVFAQENPYVPNVERWEEMAVPNMMPPAMQEKLPVRWYIDPDRKNYEGSTLSYRDATGNETIVSVCWNIEKDVYGTRDYSKVRCALKTENVGWVVGEWGEMLNMSMTTNDADEIIALTLKFNGANAEHSRTLEWKK